MPGAPQFVGEKVLRIGGTAFYYEHPLKAVPDGHLGIEKLRPLLESYVALWAEMHPGRVVELGIRQGGSTAMLCELGVDRIVSIELSDARVAALDRFVSDGDVQDIVHPHYGVNQADQERLAGIMNDEFGEQSVDLVIDDASHLYRESRASFEVLFPRLRPGGLYLLEDWRSQHMMAAALAGAIKMDHDLLRTIAQRMVDEDRAAPETPMSRLVMELVIARAVSGDVVADVAIGPDWAAVRRGPAVLDPGSFRLDDHAPDQLQVLEPIR